MLVVSEGVVMRVPPGRTRGIAVLSTVAVTGSLLALLTGCSAQQPQQTNSSNASVQEQSDSSAKIEDKTSSGSGSSGGTTSDSSKAAETKAFKLGDQISTDNYEIVVSGVEWLDEIYPPDTSGYYRYYEDEEGKTYIVAKGSYKNLWSDSTSPNWATEAKFVFNDKYNIDAEIEVVKNGEMSKSFGIDPLESSELYIWASVSDEMKGSVTSAKLVWSVPRDDFNKFYRSGSAHDTYEIGF